MKKKIPKTQESQTQSHSSHKTITESWKHIIGVFSVQVRQDDYQSVVLFPSCFPAGMSMLNIELAIKYMLFLQNWAIIISRQSFHTILFKVRYIGSVIVIRCHSDGHPSWRIGTWRQQRATERLPEVRLQRRSVAIDRWRGRAVVPRELWGPYSPSGDPMKLFCCLIKCLKVGIVL